MASNKLLSSVGTGLTQEVPTSVASYDDVANDLVVDKTKLTIEGLSDGVVSVNASGQLSSSTYVPLTYGGLGADVSALSNGVVVMDASTSLPTTITGTDGQVLTWNASLSKWEAAASPIPAAVTPNIYFYTGNATYTKSSSNVKYVRVIALGGGGGGGGGLGLASYTAALRQGGGGGGGGGITDQTFLAEFITTSMSVIIGTGGTGGAAGSPTVSPYTGVSGNTGAQTTFGASGDACYVYAGGGEGGFGGVISGDTYYSSLGGFGGIGNFPGGNGGNSGNRRVPVTAYGAGGGGGGSFSYKQSAAGATQYAYAPTEGGNSGSWNTAALAAGGTVPSVGFAGTVGTAQTLSFGFTSYAFGTPVSIRGGASGGYQSGTTTGPAGGSNSTTATGGGAGGGGGAPGGAGGNGGGGWCIVIEY
jgi:hypothetical protein